MLQHLKTYEWYAGSTGTSFKRVRHWSISIDEARRYSLVHRAKTAQRILGGFMGREPTVVHCLWFDHGRLVAVPYSDEGEALVHPGYQQAMNQGGWYETPLCSLPEMACTEDTVLNPQGAAKSGSAASTFPA